MRLLVDFNAPHPRKDLPGLIYPLLTKTGLLLNYKRQITSCIAFALQMVVKNFLKLSAIINNNTRSSIPAIDRSRVGKLINW